jgi:hypothetical protein
VRPKNNYNKLDFLNNQIDMLEVVDNLDLESNEFFTRESSNLSIHTY